MIVFADTMVQITHHREELRSVLRGLHQREELSRVRRHSIPDLQLSTRVEMGGLRRTVNAHLSVIAAVSWKLADRLVRLPPGELYVVGNLFTFATLEKAVDLIYTGHVIIEEEAADDVCDLFASWGAPEIPERLP